MPFTEITCRPCGGSGSVKHEYCNGKGTWTETSGSETLTYRCDLCSGTGRVTCDTCKGWGKEKIWIE